MKIEPKDKDMLNTLLRRVLLEENEGSLVAAVNVLRAKMKAFGVDPHKPTLDLDDDSAYWSSRYLELQREKGRYQAWISDKFAKQWYLRELEWPFGFYDYDELSVRSSIHPLTMRKERQLNPTDPITYKVGDPDGAYYFHGIPLSEVIFFAHLHKQLAGKFHFDSALKNWSFEEERPLAD
jgi:hypothetical protein